MSAPPRPIERVAVIGAGVMGAGIAQWISAHGTPVLLKDVSPEALAKGLKAAENIYRQGIKRRTFTEIEARSGLDRITPSHGDAPLALVDLVIEAAVEKLDVKQALFAQLESRARPDAVLATNTSALSIDAIASGLARPERVVGLHFFNPVHRMKLVEIIRGARTSPETVSTALRFATRLEKLPVIVKDSPGFLVNRILLPYMVEAIRLFSQGGSVGEIDRMMLDFGMPMGPLRLSDEVGLDVTQYVSKDLERRLPRPVPVGDTLERMIARGWLGKKCGLGFYRFAARDSRPRPNPEFSGLQSREAAHLRDPEVWRDRLILIMVNEAARCVEEGVVESPEAADFGMLHGTGWAPARGGPLRYADSLGAAMVVSRLEALARTVAPHFAPCEILVKMAAGNRRFHPNPLQADQGCK